MQSDFSLLVPYLCDLLSVFIGFLYRSALGVVKSCSLLVADLWSPTGVQVDFPAKVR